MLSSGAYAYKYINCWIQLFISPKKEEETEFN